jgi:CheY-like chemotaxis protein
MPTSLDPGAPKHVLLYVEDNAANLALVEQLLGRRGDITLLSSTTGERGLALARANVPDVVLLDINLPDMSGLDVLRQLAHARATALIPVIALSSDAYARQIEQGLAAGFYRYLTKPFAFPVFLAAIDDALARAALLQAHANTA